MSSKNVGHVSLVYYPHGQFFPQERVFDAMTDDDLAFLVAGLYARRMRTSQRHMDLQQLKKTRQGQIAWYADRMIEALYDGLGGWRRLLPMRVRVRIVQAQMDYLRDLTVVWTDELVALHAEATRAGGGVPLVSRRISSAPENGPRVRCGGTPTSTCTADMLLGEPLPEGWTMGVEDVPHCPEHPVVALVKETVA
ncbi:hypothetical protein [Streptomyces sp. MH60]|uniref:hypothetical protein n=1 Tax=Streptomyces sp. MH60 TaxID=1940758 RepID=UPI000CEEE8E8|nr:hypothetical protein [Streptomyces sp. MH60]PPS89432.1 hypothetical protein BZZ08_01578 [Streptomyces sp. MH60]